MDFTSHPFINDRQEKTDEIHNQAGVDVFKF